MSVPRGLIAGYRLLLVASAVILIFTNVSVFLYDQELSSIPPGYVGLAFLCLGAPLLVQRQTVSVLVRLPLVWWGMVYAIITISSFFWSSQSDVALQELRVRASWLLLLFILIIALADPTIHRAVRLVIVVALVWAIGANYWDLLHPGLFNMSIGRAAGLYENPNIAASALIVGMIAALDVVPFRWRGWFALAIAAGVLPTLSRGGVLGWCLVTSLLIWQRAILTTYLVRAGGAALVAGGLALLLLAGRSQVVGLFQLDKVFAGQLGRVIATDVDAQINDPSVEARAAVLGDAMAVAGEHPILGGGVGATVEWSRPVSTHNIYLRHLAEYGVTGIVLYPFFLVSLFGGTRGVARRRIGALVAFLAFWGLVSHNLLDGWVDLVPIALLTVEGAVSRSHRRTSRKPEVVDDLSS